MIEKSADTKNSYRRTRVDRIKKIIIIIFFILLIAPNLLCIVMFVNLIRINSRLKLIDEQMERYERQMSVYYKPGENEASFFPAEDDSKDKSAGTESGKDVDIQAGIVQAESTVVQNTEQSLPVSVPESVVEEQNRGSTDGTEMQGILENGEYYQKEYSHYVYLTFDDGPSIYTDEILDILAEYDIKATFFVLGKETEKDKERLRRIVDEGHTLGMHSYSHRYSEMYASVEKFAADFHKIQDYLYEVTGVVSKFYRFPGGSSNKVSNADMNELEKFLDEQDVTYFDWNISSGDADNIDFSVEELVSNSTKNIEKNRTSVILFHDSASKRSTVDALPHVIEKIMAMEDTIILPITQDTEPVQHNVR